MSAARRKMARKVTRDHGNIRGYFSVMYAAEEREWRENAAREERLRDELWALRAGLDRHERIVA